jgi:Cell shape-determining protein
MIRSGAIRTFLTIILFLVLEAGSLIMVVNDGAFQRAKISSVVFTVSSAIDRLSSQVRYFFNLKNINIQYQEDNLRLSQELHKYKMMVERQNLLIPVPEDSTSSTEVAVDSVFSYIPANVITNRTNTLHNFLVIDKGRKDGIESDMGVISSSGVIGIISSVSENYSFVISFLNINQKLSARITSSNAAGTITWDGRNIHRATLTEIPLHIKFSPQDTVSTSGFSSLFPANIPIGTIESSVQTQGAHHKIEVRLFQDFSTLRYVNIVRNNHRSEIDSLLNNR